MTTKRLSNGKKKDPTETMDTRVVRNEQELNA